MTNPKRPSEPVTRESLDIHAERLEQLRALVPEAFAKGKLDKGQLLEALDLADDDGKAERYSFTWAGKRDAQKILQVPSRATLIPAPEESIDWETTENVFIEGENLEVLKLLLKPYFGRVKMIYIDPPYNTGNDFVYPDSYADPLDTYLRLTGQKDGNGNLVTSNPETSGRYHSAWLSMMYPRLFLARQLLREDGVIFVSIDDREVDTLRLLLNQVFGEEGFVGRIIWNNATDNNPTNVAVEHEYVLCYSKDKNYLSKEWKSPISAVKDILVKEGQRLVREYPNQEARQKAYSKWFKNHKAFLWPLDRYKYIDEGGIYTGSQSVHNPGREGYRYDVIHPITGRPCKQPLMGYRFPEETMNGLLEAGKILFGDDESKIVELKLYAEEYRTKLPSIIHLDGRLGAYEFADLFPQNRRAFNNPKPSEFIRFLASFVLEEKDYCLDFFSGSSATHHALAKISSAGHSKPRLISVQLPEPTENQDFPTIAEIGKERIRRVIKRIKDEQKVELPLKDRSEQDLGFRVFKLAESNYRPWRGTEEKDPESYQTELTGFLDPLKDGWQDHPERVIWEVAIKEGYGLNSRVTKVEAVTGQTLWQVTDPDKEQTFFICLDDSLKLEALAPLELSQEHLFVYRDSAGDDTLAANLALQCRVKTI